MKVLLQKFVSWGIDPALTAHQQRLIRTTNILNLIVIGLVFLSLINVFALGSEFSFAAVLCILVLACLSLLLNRFRYTRWAFLVFTFYVNLSIFYFCMHHPFETENYLYYFPVIISVVLLNNPSFSDKFSLVHLGVCAIFLFATFLLKFPAIELPMSDEKILFLRTFNIITAFLITVVLSIMLTRLISEQNEEIVVQNTDLIKAKEIVNASLKEKEVLLAELHHRVKNNLAIISGLLNLQDDATTNEEAKDIIGESKTRIMSMALVHRMLYENSELKHLDLERYISELIKELFHSYNLEKRVKIEQHFEKVELPVSKCIPLGLIINEVVTNSIKYAFRMRSGGIMQVFVKNIGGQVRISMRDDGKGFGKNFNAEGEDVSLGIYLIKTLTEQLEGKVSFRNEAGARIDLEFPV